MKFKTQAETYLREAQTRRRNPIRPGTARIYQSYLDARILPYLGNFDLELIENGVAKDFIAGLNNASLAAQTVNDIFRVVKAVIASAVDSNGNELYPRKWNPDYIDLPVVSQTDRETPTITPEQVVQACQAADRQDRTLMTLLAASGLRIGEALALYAYSAKRFHPENTTFWYPSTGTISVNSTLKAGKVLPQPKTEAGRREIDLHPDINQYLIESGLAEDAGNAPLFRSESGGTARIETIYDHLEDYGIQGGFHAFRRFRITHLESQNVPRGLQMFWTGHAPRDVHETYIKMGRDLKTRRDWAIKAGYGFDLK